MKFSIDITAEEIYTNSTKSDIYIARLMFVVYMILLLFFSIPNGTYDFLYFDITFINMYTQFPKIWFGGILYMLIIAGTARAIRWIYERNEIADVYWKAYNDPYRS